MPGDPLQAHKNIECLAFTAMSMRGSDVCWFARKASEASDHRQMCPLQFADKDVSCHGPVVHHFRYMAGVMHSTCSRLAVHLLCHL